MDYQQLYNDYWRRDDRRGEHSFGSVASVADEILACVGVGKVLDVGCGNGHLVRRLNALGADAVGVDVSDVAVEVANAASPGRFSVANITSLPFEADSFDCVVSTDCFEHLDEADVPAALAELRRVSRGSVYLRIALTEDRDSKWHLTIQNREWWETRCFEAGFRKHPRYFLASPFGCLDSQLEHCTILLEKLPDQVNKRFPLDKLIEERQLHTDMSREAGRRSDAHNMRYFEAARCVRPGDRVLDIACGLGYGSTILTHNSRSGSYLGIDNSDFAIEYAEANFGGPATRFERGSLPECLADMPDASVDYIASFETLEHLKDNRGFLDECQRLLTPGGRLTISVPHDWTEADGRDPNPWHFHVYDWPRILAELAEAGFLIEKTISETVSRRKEQGEWAKHGYEWRDHAVEQVTDKPGEWCVVLAMKSPQPCARAAFTNTAFPETAGAEPTNVMDFAGQYRNPWIAPALLTRGLRTTRLALRRELAEQVMASSTGEPDEAAALCVAAYALVDSEGDWGESAALLARAEPHWADRDWSAEPPIRVRWAVSLRYVAALLCLQGGRREDAKRHLTACTELPALRYSPLLATKTVGAAVRLATLAIADQDDDGVHTWCAKGLALTEQAVGQDWRAALGDPARQPLAALHELAEVMELAAQCSAGLSLPPTNQPAAVSFEQFQSTSANEIRRLTDENARLLAENTRTSTALAWHQEQLKTWYEASHFWQDQAEQLKARFDLPHAGVSGPRNPLSKLRRSVSKRVRKLKQSLRGDG